MAKELPYFKFEPSEWENGNIQMFSFSEKGLFIEICSMYWSRLGDLPEKLVIQKLCGGNAVALSSLCEENVIKVIDGLICIDFLNEQLLEFENISNKNKYNALKGWEIRRNKAVHASALPKTSEGNAIREEKKREEERREEKIVLLKKEPKEDLEIEKQKQFLFDKFWNDYDKKVGLEKCRKKFFKLSRDEMQRLFQNLEKYIQATPDKQYRKNPETYLNNKSFNDEIIDKNGTVNSDNKDNKWGNFKVW